MNELEKKAAVQKREDVLEKAIPEAVNEQHEKVIENLSGVCFLASKEFQNATTNSMACGIYYAAALLSGSKISQESVARLFGVGSNTVRKYYTRILEVKDETTALKWSELDCPDCGESMIVPKAAMSEIEYEDIGRVTYENFLCGNCGEAKTWTVTFDV